MVKQLKLPLGEVLPLASLPLSIEGNSTFSTFTDNMKLPVHRWFRFSAGFSASWVETVIAKAKERGSATVFDPFAGAGTTLLAAEKMGVECLGVEAHPFVARIASAKLLYRIDPELYLEHIRKVKIRAQKLSGCVDNYPALIRSCFSDRSLEGLNRLWQAWEQLADDSPQSELAWLTIIAILRHVSCVGTAPWQYILPNQTKKSALSPMSAFELMVQTQIQDMRIAGSTAANTAKILRSDARTCLGVPDDFADLIVTSPPYANNYDYADATRLEMCFAGEIKGWGDLQHAVRQYLIRSCSQHVTSKNVNLDEVLASAELEPIRSDLVEVCSRLSKERHLHGGKKNYHLMVACYFLDLAKVWLSLRRVCKHPATVCFVIGDSAPYGIYVPVIEWMVRLALAAGFQSFIFEKTRDRNVKWKNRKHNVPLCEGCLWVTG